MTIDITRRPATPGSYRARMVNVINEPSKLGDKAARDACQNLHNVVKLAAEADAEVQATHNEIARIGAELAELAKTGQPMDTAPLVEARQKHAEAVERAAVARSGVEPAFARYVEALAGAKAWRARLLKERGEFARRAVELAEAALAAAQSAEDALTLARIITDPHKSVNQNSEAARTAELFLDSLKPHLPKETP